MALALCSPHRLPCSGLLSPGRSLSPAEVEGRGFPSLTLKPTFAHPLVIVTLSHSALPAWPVLDGGQCPCGLALKTSG